MSFREQIVQQALELLPRFSATYGEQSPVVQNLQRLINQANSGNSEALVELTSIVNLPEPIQRLRQLSIEENEARAALESSRNEYMSTLTSMSEKISQVLQLQREQQQARQEQMDQFQQDMLMARAEAYNRGGPPFEFPDHLIINGLRVDFVPFQQIANKLSQNQIERYIIEPSLQSLAGRPGTPNRIFTMFGRNGMTYLVKAMYNPQTNQIFPPV